MNAKTTKLWGAMLVALLGVNCMAQQRIRVTLDGQDVNFSGTSPRYVQGRVLVPLRGIFEEMGANVHWTDATQTVEATKGDTDISLTIGDHNATVNGRSVPLDVPAMLIGGSTMVPLRFVSESLGADVNWDDADQTVLITTANGANDDAARRERLARQQRDRENRQRLEQTERMRRERSRTMAVNTVIPILLDTTLSSHDARRGDTFTGTLMTEDRENYGVLPQDTKIEGIVREARPQHGNDPGLLDLSFDKIILPDGRTVRIDGSLTSLDARDTRRNSDGTLTSTRSSKDHRLVYAGYGAGAGLLVGLITKRPLEGTILGGLVGLLAGVAENDKRHPSNVTLKAGTQMGVRLNSDVSVPR